LGSCLKVGIAEVIKVFFIFQAEVIVPVLTGTKAGQLLGVITPPPDKHPVDVERPAEEFAEIFASDLDPEPMHELPLPPVLRRSILRRIVSLASHRTVELAALAIYFLPLPSTLPTTRMYGWSAGRHS
jgi:hypothetical protein